MTSKTIISNSNFLLYIIHNTVKLQFLQDTEECDSVIFIIIIISKQPFQCTSYDCVLERQVEI